MTIYRIYNDNGDRAGFWVQHRKWKDWCALVLTINAKAEGPLPGTAPYHDDAPVEFQWYDIRSGRKLDTPPILEDLRDKNYATIAVPSWSRRAEGEGRRYRMVSGGSKAR